MIFSTYHGFDVGTGLAAQDRRPVASLARVLKALPPNLSPPATIPYSGNSGNALAQNYLQNQYGVCVTAAIAHCVGLLTGLSGAGQVVWEPKHVIDFHTATAGSPPTPTSKASIARALEIWMTYGAPLGTSHKILGFANLDGKKTLEVQTAFWLFAVMILGCDFPLAWANNLRPGFVWGPDNGPVGERHTIMATDAEPDGFVVDSHGIRGKLLYPAVATNFSRQRGGEVWTALSPDILNAAGKAPSNLGLADLIGLFNMIDGHPPIPLPAPPPPPPASDLTIFVNQPLPAGTYRLTRV